ncbi:hypothetical protein LX87_05669 [Larkinella arboricola]|uniref:Uncharacterized protein n=1 Tax=Larkinella arboricola TaxID=643671 RepID=A0A327WNK7_LARAB|nr:hypothetical protein [Larkinella arboricola]RAJ89770.1 hypothetical protein LX87_05669 [Larkinella arboricola]
MRIEFLPRLLRIHYQYENVKTIEYDVDGYLTVYNRDDKKVAEFKTVSSIAYNAQYGTPITEDGQFVFIGTWERGLFCYSIKDQQLVWKQGPGRVRQILLMDSCLIVEMAQRGIYKRDVKTGELLQVLKMPSIDRFSQLSESELLAGPLRGKYIHYHLPSLQPK